jgi:hypothetical protein
LLQRFCGAACSAALLLARRACAADLQPPQRQLHCACWLTCLLPPRAQVMASLEAAAKVPKPPLSDLFTDVYREMPWHLKEQMQQTFEAVRRHPELCPADMEVE